MMRNQFYNLSNAEKRNLFEEIKTRTGLPPYAIEKDWWVTQTLEIIFELEVADYLLFKGGTSLSKAWHLTQRFSEDIDLSLDRTYLGFDSGLISKTQVKKLRETSFKFATTTFFKNLQKAFTEKGYTNVTFAFENLGDGDQDPVSILIYYPAITAHSKYVLPRVKIELGSRSLKNPFTFCKIQSFVSEQFPNLPFEENTINIPCVNPERTYLEKLFLLHEEFKKPKDKIRVKRLSRHLYDITKIYKSAYKEKAYNEALIKSIIQHRERFNGMRGVNYATLYPPHLKPIPPDDLIKAWEDDYKTMQTNMIPVNSPSFKDLLATVSKATQEYNALKNIYPNEQ